jgi:hypothetical protein
MCDSFPHPSLRHSDESASGKKYPRLQLLTIETQ